MLWEHETWTIRFQTGTGVLDRERESTLLHYAMDTDGKAVHRQHSSVVNDEVGAFQGIAVSGMTHEYIPPFHAYVHAYVQCVLLEQGVVLYSFWI